MTYWGTVMDPTSETQYGKRLLPVVINEIATNEPDRVCFSFPCSVDLSAGFHDIKFQTFANAVNKTAWFIEKEIGRSSMFETVMYMGHPDVRHFIVLIALMKTGHKVLFSSHLNSVAGHSDLIKWSDCGILLYTAGFPVTGLLETSRMESLCMPELDYLLDDSIDTAPYPYNKTFEQAKHHPAMVIHNSDSKGVQKPLIWTHWQFATTDAQRLVPDMQGRPSLWGSVRDSSRRCYLGLPVFHGAGIATALFQVLFNHCVIVLGPGTTPTASILSQVLDHGRIDAASLSPSILEDITTSPSCLAKLERLNFVTIGASSTGSLSKEAGDLVAKHTHLYSIIANTESSTLIQHATDREDWQYACINEEYNGIVWRPRGGDLYELTFRRDPELADMQGVFKTLPGAQEISMFDLYEKHPTKPHHWKKAEQTA